MSRLAPPITFDGRFFWYTDWFDPSDDRCSLCCAAIPEDAVPLCLFKGVGRKTWQARFCDSCTGTVAKMLVLGRAPR
jgi:hypothetical protein